MNELIKLENNELTVLPEILEKMRQLNKVKIEAELLELQVRDALKNAMAENGIKEFDNEVFTATYVAPTTRNSLNTKALKEELPQVYETYLKTSNVKDSVRIKYKDD